MKRNILSWLLAPSPIILIILVGCAYVLLSSPDVINGEIDNAPMRAALIHIVLIPFLFYPGSLLLFSVQILIARKLKGKFKKNIVISLLAVSFAVAALFAAGIYQPKFGESFLLTWGACSLVFIVLLFSMTMAWRIIRGSFN